MNEFIFQSVCLAFAVRFAHSLASEAGLPGNGSLRLCCNCGKLPGQQVTQYPLPAGSGEGRPPRREYEGGALAVLDENE